MGNKKFVFDKDSGTLKPARAVSGVSEVGRPLALSNAEPKSSSSQTQKENMKKVDLSTSKPNVDMNESIVKFREASDLTILEIVEERSQKPMMVIAGYGLEIKFNMAELRTTERIEQLLGGLSNLFRKMIVEQALGKPSR